MARSKKEQLANVAQQYVEEYDKCKHDFHYFCENYIYLDLAGESVKMKEYQRQKDLINTFQDKKYMIVLKSRQIGISTVFQAYAAWLMVFNDNMVVGIVSKDGPEATDFARKIMSMIDQLPKWLVKKDKNGNPFNKRAEQSFILQNKSKLYTSPVNPSSPDKCLRGKSISFLIIDEAAFIRHIDEAWTSMVPALSTAQKAARHANVPYGTIIVSTPNKTMGAGKWYFEKYQRALLNQENNSALAGDFVPFIIHWKQIPELADDPLWYETQCRNFDNNPKKIQQELELKFLPAGGSFFDTDTCTTLQEMTQEVNTVHKLKVNQGELQYYEYPQAGKYYLIGVDTATKYGEDMSAIEVFDYESMSQVAEYHGKLPVLEFADVVQDVYLQYPGLLIIENNSIGDPLIEKLEKSGRNLNIYYQTSPQIDAKNQGKREGKWGLSNTLATRPKMIDALLEYVSKYPSTIKSARLAMELIGLVHNKTNGKVEADEGCHDDLAMAASMCYYVRKWDPPLGVQVSTDDMAIDMLEEFNRMNQGIGSFQNLEDANNYIRKNFDEIYKKNGSFITTSDFIDFF